ncbi:uncharacterized protein CANTADRAFT_25698 [Suhomyces tanzawaensis NRRL Y-17324]|uniref:Calcofluor white hypersensitive protein n=1 Tax=Suhomyces tanzawaensis NRRL Y-17324 TaxID=984487 RepID=A0A1E4SKD8_9ASCO|nr:uncharacterized protein CANTADRAFT_25698 [Suhomyces tanzawaensis NRRL Y-17324]ODV79892.1 hypothetical protein CANTADRAFT_25698 [Suhomyces tanzawaensis NRRL Y-17324]
MGNKLKLAVAEPTLAGAATTDVAETLFFSFNASYIAYAHTICAYTAFLSAFVVGCYLHYYKIVENASFGYPDEWFPSVSATIGDRYPERSVFQVVIAVTSGPRFLLLAFNFVKLYKPNSAKPWLALISGVLRTFTCGGWVYITSTDDHDFHDIFMILYLVLTIPWTVFVTIASPKGSTVRTGRFYTAVTFFGTLVPLVYWFIQHKVHVRPGAYSIYAYFEWSLVLWDVAFDAWSILDFSDIEIRIFSTGVAFAPAKKTLAAAKTETKTQADEFSTVEFLVNLINAYIFWTVITALLLCVWYFPLWYMGLSGYEVTIISIFVPNIFLAFPFIRNFFARFPLVGRTLTVIFGIGAYKLEDPEQKLMAVTAGTFFAIASFVTEFWALSTQPKKFTSFSTTFIVGLLTTTVLKYVFYSNNPVWPIMHEANGGYNATGIFVGLLGAFFTPSVIAPASTKTVQRSGGSLLLASVGFAGYFYSIQAYLGDSGTLVTWIWEGFPIRGATPITGGIVFFIAFIFGVIAALKVNSKVLSSIYYNLIVGGGSAIVFFNLKGWNGFAGAALHVLYLASITPIIFEGLVGFNPGAAFFLGFLIDILISLGSIWVVAYAFVPGGPLLRERMDLIVIVSFALILLGVLNYNLRIQSSHITKLNQGKNLFKQTLTVLTVLLAISASTFIKRYPTVPYKPYNEESRSFTAGIWCVHFGLDNDMWSSETRMKNLIEEAQVDIIGLLETDTQRMIGGNRDFTQTIAEELGMYTDYGPGPNKHTWGSALLSKFPIINSTHHLLPSPVGELAPAIHATLDIYGELVDVVVFHSGQEEDVEDRRLQSLGIRDILGSSNRPRVLLSYLVTEPLTGNYNTYVSEESGVYDIDSTDWDRWCEYILFRDLKKVAYARISRSTITDTELQIAKFKLLTDEQKEANDIDFLYGNHYVNEEDIDENLRMPQLFRGDGVRGHRYHVFDEPRYFAP